MARSYLSRLHREKLTRVALGHEGTNYCNKRDMTT